MQLADGATPPLTLDNPQLLDTCSACADNHEPVLPAWIESFIKSGYAHYCTLLPTAFAGEATVRQVAAMLGFLFSMESLALSLGCDRTQLELAVALSHPEEPSKAALLWAAQVQLGRLSRADLRARCDELLGDPLALPAYPRYLSGFVHALEPVPTLTDFVVEAVSNAFARLPDPVLLPWLPILISTLRSGGAELAPLLVREAGRIFPRQLAALDEWMPPWRSQEGPQAVSAARRAGGGRGVALLTTHPATCDAAVMLLVPDGTWETADPGQATTALATRYLDTAAALGALLLAPSS
jgi:hypothetical protein